MGKTIVLAYSGGLDTSAIIPWLKDEEPGCRVLAYCGDVGQGAEELEGLEEKAIRSGAESCVVQDLRREFVTDFIEPTLITGAVYEGRYLLGTSMARPILARAMAEYALQQDADALCHGCTGKGNDQVRFDTTFAAVAPTLEIIAPWRTWAFQSREDLLAYLEEKQVETAASATKIYSRDANLWHISHEGGDIEDPWNEPPEDAWMRTADPLNAPNEPENVTLGIEHGRARAVNGKRLEPEAVIETLNEIAEPHGVGRIDIVENRVVGMKSRGLYETPGGTILVEALRALEELTLDRKTRRFREELGLRFADLVYEGRWYTPVRESIQAAGESIAQRVNGEVVVQLHKGRATATRRRSPDSLYSEEYATFGVDNVYHQSDAAGFIRLFSLPERIQAMKARGEMDHQPGDAR
ncbi:MAG: argininosuccinate synthase [Planctomycetota bacterium]